jgi:erythritol transport system permease protein
MTRIVTQMMQTRHAGPTERLETFFMTVAIKSAAPGATLGEAPLLLLLKLRTFIALFAVVIFFSFAAHNFLSIENLLIMSRHVALNAFLAIGMTFVIVAGGIDLSVGSIVGLSGMIAGGLILNGIPLGSSYTL